MKGGFIYEGNVCIAEKRKKRKMLGGLRCTIIRALQGKRSIRCLHTAFWEEGSLVTEIAIADHKLCLIVLIGDAVED